MFRITKGLDAPITSLSKSTSPRLDLSTTGLDKMITRVDLTLPRLGIAIVIAELEVSSS